MAKDERRVVVTGLGVVSSIGIGWQEFWPNLIAGKSGISKVTAFDTSAYDRHYAGEVKNFDPTKFMDAKKASQMGRSSQMAIAASKMALEDAGITKDNMMMDSLGCSIGTTEGECQVIEESVAYKVKNGEMPKDKTFALTYPAAVITQNLALELNFRNKNIIFSNACAAGNTAIGYAFDRIKLAHQKIMIAGGVDSLSRIAFTGFNRLLAMAPEKCQPFDKNRKGMMVGEGAGILILEEEEHAKKRGAQIYAEILGYGMSCDANHMTTPNSDSIAKAIKKALKNSGKNKNEIDYISVHGTGTRENDKTESQAIAKVFKESAPSIPVSSIKSMLGHTMGAASAIEALSCCLAITKKQIPPTINFKEKDVECMLDCVPNKSRKLDLNVALNNSQAFGGINAASIFCKGIF